MRCNFSKTYNNKCLINDSFLDHLVLALQIYGSDSLNYYLKDDVFTWMVSGTYNNVIPVDFDIELSPTGLMTISYQVDNIPDNYIREIGVRFILFDRFDSLSWDREGYWSYYPPNSLSVDQGRVALKSPIQNRYRQQPGKKWPFDTKSFYYDGTSPEKIEIELTNISKSSKEKVHEYKLTSTHMTKHINVLGNGNITCRIARANENMMLYANNISDYVDLSWGNYQRNLKLSDSFSGELTLSIVDSE